MHIGLKRLEPARRATTLTALIGAALFVLVAAGLYFFGLRNERITDYHVEVAIQHDKSALVRETFTYDFGSANKHGVEFEPVGTFEPTHMPHEMLVTGVKVRSASAPSKYEILRSDDLVRVGDPDETVSGRQTYEITYRRTNAATLTGGLAGTEVMAKWRVPIDKIDYTVYAPYALADPQCSVLPESQDCDAHGVSRSTVTAHAENLGALDAVSVFSKKGPATGADATLPAPKPLPVGDSSWWFLPLVVIPCAGLVGYAVGAVVAAWWIRRATRDHVGPNGERISTAAADAQVMVQSVPPKDLTPAQAGIVWDGRVTDTHRVAWLAQQAEDRWISVSANGRTLTRTASDAEWNKAPKPLVTLMKGHRTVHLGTYRENVAKGWEAIGDELEKWRTSSGLLDVAAQKRVRVVQLAVGAVGLLAAVGGAVGLYFLATASLKVAVAVAVAAAVLVGAGVSAMTRTALVRVRTPQGFAARQQIAGFRRHVESSDVAGRGEPGTHATWAGALGLLDRRRDRPGTVATTVFNGIAAAMPATITSPGSSSGPHTYTGGSTGGSIGGGGGGGGGGSW